MKTPDVPKGYIVAILCAVFALATAFGVPMSAEKQQAITNVVLVLAPVFVLATTWLHTTRAKNAESILKAKAVQAAADAHVAAAKAEATAAEVPAVGA